MKPFNLELAKAGHPICTREGKDAIFVYDSNINKPYNILVVVKDTPHTEMGIWYTCKGICYSAKTKYDLFMASRKKSVWKNFYKEFGNIVCGCHSYNTKEKAKENIEFDKSKLSDTSANYLCTRKIEWEEH